jgi:acetate kinase
LKAGLLQANSSADQPKTVLKFLISGIGDEDSLVMIEQPGKLTNSSKQPINDMSAAMDVLFDTLMNMQLVESIQATGHRVVHGGSKFHQPVTITDDVEAYLHSVTQLAPHHMPSALQLIAFLRKKLPDCSHVACFDTGFFNAVPRLAQIMAIPRSFTDEGVRRYGFHGLSYQHLRLSFSKLAGEAAVNGRVVYAHLGSGASLAATKNGHPVDMTMGFSPASGVMMSSRSGDLDPTLGSYLQQKQGLTAKEYDHMVNFESGLLGVSGVSHDMQVLIQEMERQDGAQEAVELFCYQVAKSVASLASTIGGLDSLIFSGGIGENAPLVRRMVCEQLSYMGIALDDSANQEHAGLISSVESIIGVHTIRSDESQTIAQEVYKLTKNKD